MLSYIALALLLISLLNSGQALRAWGIASALCYCLAYLDDAVIVITNIVIVLVHSYKLSQAIDHERLTNRLTNSS